METWFGAAAVCINENNEILMVKGYDSDAWAIPSGAIEIGESPEECCIREVLEETGYHVSIIEKIFIKETIIDHIDVKIHYFIVKKLGESIGIKDPDNIIEKAEWKSLSEIERIKHMYPEDIELIVSVIKNGNNKL